MQTTLALHTLAIQTDRKPKNPVAKNKMDLKSFINSNSKELYLWTILNGSTKPIIITFRTSKLKNSSTIDFEFELLV